jgi:hypothetical protein
MTGTISLLLVLLSIMSNASWQGAGIRIFVESRKEGVAKRYYYVTMRISFAIALLCYVFLIANGKLWSLNVFDILFYLCLIPVIIHVWRSLKSRKSPIENTMFEKKWMNFMAIELTLSYATVWMWISLMILAANS